MISQAGLSESRLNLFSPSTIACADFRPHCFSSGPVILGNEPVVLGLADFAFLEGFFKRFFRSAFLHYNPSISLPGEPQ